MEVLCFCHILNRSSFLLTVELYYEGVPLWELLNRENSLRRTIAVLVMQEPQSNIFTLSQVSPYCLE